MAPARHPSDDGRRSGDSGFPGGRPSLPRLRDEEETGETEIHFVGSAFLHAGQNRSGNEEPQSGFSDYFSTESLFVGPDLEDEIEVTDPFRVLGIDSSASWETVAKAHRRLCKSLHPDSHPNATPEQREFAELSIRRVNEAFNELRRTYRLRELPVGSGGS